MARVRIGEFRDNVSEFVRRAEHGETIVIVNREREVAELRPRAAPGRRSKTLLGYMKGTARLRGDLLASIPAEEWFRT